MTYNHWLCFLEAPKNRVPYFFRQCEGEYLADLVLCNSLTQRDALVQQTRCIPSMNYLKFKVLEPPVDEDLIIQYTSASDKFEQDLILFNHRLSLQSEYAENLRNFAAIIDTVKDAYPGLRVLFTNPSGYEIKDLKPWMQCTTLPRKDYIELLAAKPLTCGLFSSKRMWSMSLSESNAFGGLSVVPSHSCFLEMYPINYQYFFSGGNLGEARDKLIFLLKNPEVRIEHGKRLQNFVVKHFSNKIKAREVYKMLKDLVGGEHGN